MTSLKSAGLAAFLILANSVPSSGGEKEEPYRPETGKFPPIEKPMSTGANLSSWIMPTGAAASAWRERASFTATTPTPSPCFLTAWSVTIMLRRIFAMFR